MTLGTDLPVEDMRPLATFYAAITRLSYDGDSPHGRGGWFPEQRMTRLEALRGKLNQMSTCSHQIPQMFLLTHGHRNDHRSRLCLFHREHTRLDRTEEACGLRRPLPRYHGGPSRGDSEDRNPSHRDGRGSCLWEGLISTLATLQHCPH